MNIPFMRRRSTLGPPARTFTETLPDGTTRKHEFYTEAQAGDELRAAEEYERRSPVVAWFTGAVVAGGVAAVGGVAKRLL